MAHVAELTDTPKALRLHIGFLGKRNSGKSSLINALATQEVSLVSDTPGTTTDPVHKTMEIHPLGPCILIDTAGFDDEGELGEKRVEKTNDILDQLDSAIMIFNPEDRSLDYEKIWHQKLKERMIPVLGVVNKIDTSKDIETFVRQIEQTFSIKVITVSAKGNLHIERLRESIVDITPKDVAHTSLTAHLVQEGDRVLLIAPQDIQAPKGRLILPQVQIIRDLLDNKTIVTVITTDKLKETLEGFKEPPKLIITDSQVFHEVYGQVPKESMLTSFSVLMARHKGDIDAFVEGADTLDNLDITKKILILEACTHNPLDGDIGREKIPKMLRKKYGSNLQIEIKNGKNFPDDLTPYALVIHCGGCMFNRKLMLSRIRACKVQGVAITNYGIFISKMTGILEHITL